MVDKVNGGAYNGEWITGDLRFLTVTAVGGDFLTDQSKKVDGEWKDRPKSKITKVYEVLSTRSTPVIMRASDETTIFVAVDLAAGDFNDTAVVDELIAGIDAIDGLSGTTIVEGAFAVA